MQEQVPAQGLWFWQLKVTLLEPQKALHALISSEQEAHLPSSQSGAGGWSGVARAGAAGAETTGAGAGAGEGAGAASASAAQSRERQASRVEVRFIGSPSGGYWRRTMRRPIESGASSAAEGGIPPVPRNLLLLPSAAVDDLRRPLEEAVARWDRLGWPRPAVALVSGSGLGFDLAPPAHGPVPLADLIPFPVHAVEGHPLSVEVLLPRPGRAVLYQRGRLHSYQGYDAHETVFPVRLAARLGARALLFTNAAGGVRPGLAPGDLVLLRDQINLTGLNPLRGQLPPEWGPRFPDMSRAYDPALAALARAAAAGLGIPLEEGVYAGVAGPSYETPAEVRMLAMLGGDVTGMSTALEVIAARHMGLRCLGISLVANAAAEEGAPPIDHADVLAAGRRAGEALARLLAALLAHPALLDEPGGAAGG